MWNYTDSKIEKSIWIVVRSQNALNGLCLGVFQFLLVLANLLAFKFKNFSIILQWTAKRKYHSNGYEFENLTIHF